MRDAGLVSFRQPIGQLRGYPDYLLDRQRTRATDLAKRLPFNQFHYDVIQRTDLSDLVNRDYARVIESRRCSCLTLKTLDPLPVRGEFFRQNLDRYVSTQLCVPGPVDLAHSTCTQQAEDSVGADHPPCHGSGRIDRLRSDRPAQVSGLLK